MASEDLGPEDLTGYVTTGTNGSLVTYVHEHNANAPEVVTRGESVRDALARCRAAALASYAEKRARMGEVLR